MRIYLIKKQKNKTPINFSESASSFSRPTLASCYIQNRCSSSSFIQSPLYSRTSLYYSLACLLMSLKSNITASSSALSSLSKEGKNICGEVSGQLWLKYLKHTTCKNQRSHDASYFIKGCKYNTVLVKHSCFSSVLYFCKSILYTLFLPLLKRLLFCCFNSILFIFIVALT